jgi:Ran GTPase-activating protein (RanGAP) involved in mRNA processing and transport
LSVTHLNVSNNDITDTGCEKLWEFLIVNNDTVALNIDTVNFSKNKIKDRSVDILVTLCEENANLKTLNLQKNQFRSKLALKKFSEFQDKNVLI